MKKILILSGCKIFPNQSGGHLRSGSVAKSLARLGNEVCIYGIAGRKTDYGKGQSMLYQGIEENLVEEVNLSLPIGIVQSVSRKLGLPRIWQFLLLSLGLIPRSLRTRLEWADIIICDSPYTPRIPGLHENKIWILLSHNLEYKLMSQGSRAEKFFASWMEGKERLVPLQYDGVLACAKQDAEFFKALTKNPEQVRLVPNGIDPENYTRWEVEGQKIRSDLGVTDQDHLIVFSGSRFQPNLDALQKLDIFCQKEQKFLNESRIRFLILGSICSEPKTTSTQLITGPVPDTYPYFASADAALNPVQTGSGSNVKIFEYVAARLPVLSTVFGTRGTELIAERDYLAFDDDASLKAALQAYLVTKSKAEWKEHAAEVWGRVQDSCDMTSILRKEWKGLQLDKSSSASKTLLS